MGAMGSDDSAADRSVASYFVQLFISPGRAMQALLGDRRRSLVGLAGISSLVLVYVLGISLTLSRHPGTGPLQAPALRIAPEHYYYYELVFLLPVALASVVVQAGISHLVCRIRGCSGSFDDLFALIGFSYLVVAVVIGVPDLVLGFFARPAAVGPHVLLGTIWFCVLCVKAVKAAERVPWLNAIVAGILGLLANGALEFTFMR